MFKCVLCLAIGAVIGAYAVLVMISGIDEEEEDIGKAVINAAPHDKKEKSW